MPLSGVPPWLNVGPTDFLRAAQAGAQLGLERERLREQSKEAADRLAESERESDAAHAIQQSELQQRSQQEAAAMALNQARLGREDASQAQRFQLGQGNLALRTAANRLAENRATQQDTNRSQMLDLARQRLALEKGKVDKTKDTSPVYTLPIPGQNKFETGGTVRGRLSEIAPILGTNLPPSLRAAVPKAGQEVTRLTKDGRKAIFDATTRKFLRYAE